MDVVFDIPLDMTLRWWLYLVATIITAYCVADTCISHMLLSTMHMAQVVAVPRRLTLAKPR